MPALHKHLRHLPAGLGALLLCGAVYVVQREFHHLRLVDIGHAVQDIPAASLWIAAGWTVLSYGVLTFYDRLGTIYAGHKVSYGKAAFASFCAYALSHNLGFAAVSGAAVRYRLYAHWGLSPLQIAKIVAFCSLTFGLGGMVLGGLILFLEPRAVPFFGERVPLWTLHAAGGLLWAIVAGYVTLSKIIGHVRMFGARIKLPGWRMAIVQVLLATADVAVTTAIFDALLPPAEGLTYVRFVGVYVASYTAGLAANLPGGIGVFDSAMLLGLAPYLPAPPIVGAILIFRLYYYVVPLFLAGSLFAGNELLLRGGALVRRGFLARRIQMVGRWSEPELAVAATTGTVALCGAMLLSLGVLQPRPDWSWVAPDLAEVATNAGQYVPSLIGTALMVLAVGLSQRVTLAWWITLALLPCAAAFTAAQGQSTWIPGVLLLAVALIAPFRSAYYRHARLISGPLEASTALPLFALVVCVLALASFRPHVRYLTANSWWAVVMSKEVPNGLRFTVALTVLLALAAAWRLIRPGRVTSLPWTPDARQRYLALAQGHLPPVEADGMVLGESARAAIAFRRLGRVLLGLSDPVGAESDQVSAIWRLRDLASQEGLDPAFWSASPRLLQVYADLGLTALPLGPTGIPLPDTEVPDPPPPGSSFLCCVAERDLNTLLPLLPALARRVRQAAE